MGTTATSSLGYGVKVKTDTFQKMGLPHQYPDEILDTVKYPALNVQLSGFSPENDFWVFITSTTQVVYSGPSGDGMEAIVNSRMQINERDAKQLRSWMDEHGHADFPSWNLIQYIN